MYMCVYVCMCVYIYIYIYIYVCVCVCPCPCPCLRSCRSFSPRVGPAYLSGCTYASIWVIWGFENKSTAIIIIQKYEYIEFEQAN